MASIGPVGSMIYANQNMQAAATKQTAFQNRTEMHSVMATAVAQEKDKIVQEVRPAEEIHKIDPEKEHEKERNEEESGAKQEETARDTKHKRLKRSEDDETHPTSLLDIMV